jgi:hypothetical protein
MKNCLIDQLFSKFDDLLFKVLDKILPGKPPRPWPSETNYDAFLRYTGPCLWNAMYGRTLYSMHMAEDADAGSTEFELMLTGGSPIHSKRVGRILYWDTNRECTFETFGEDVPTMILEPLIAEAKRSIKQ